MIGILRNSDTARIRFRYRSGSLDLSVNADVFRRVAALLESGYLNVVENRFPDNRMTYSAWSDSSTNDAANTFYLGRHNRSSRDFDALVVHESVHAYMDIARISIPWVDNEAIAYIAQGFYLKNSGYPSSRMEYGEPYRVGYLIAETISSGIDASDMIGDLRSNLLSDQRYTHYIRSTFRGDG
ncbi:MAG: hypothetical protein C4325_07770 [Blastocatellia bacterium]